MLLQQWKAFEGVMPLRREVGQFERQRIEQIRRRRDRGVKKVSFCDYHKSKGLIFRDFSSYPTLGLLFCWGVTLPQNSINIYLRNGGKVKYQLFKINLKMHIIMV